MISDLITTVSKAHFIVNIVYFAGHPAIAVNVSENYMERCEDGARSSADAKSVIDSIYDGFMFAVPKSRRSREKRAIRRLGWTRVVDYMTPRRNLVECLDCGEWHEGHTICGRLQQAVFVWSFCFKFFLMSWMWALGLLIRADCSLWATCMQLSYCLICYLLSQV